MHALILSTLKSTSPFPADAHGQRVNKRPVRFTLFLCQSNHFYIFLTDITDASSCSQLLSLCFRGRTRVCPRRTHGILTQADWALSLFL